MKRLILAAAALSGACLAQPALASPSTSNNCAFYTTFPSAASLVPCVYGTGTVNAVTAYWPYQQLWDGANAITVKAGSTAPVSTDTALVVTARDAVSIAASQTIGATQIGAWSAGRTWTLSNGTDTVAVSQASAGSLNATVVGAGAAGTPAGGVLSMQGVSGGQPVPITGTVSASIGNFAPTPAYATLSASTSTNRVALPTGTSVIVYNTGAADASVTLGGSGVTAATTDDVVKAGGWMQYTIGANTYLAAITASGSTSLTLSGGSGIAAGSGGGSGSVPTGTAGAPNASVVTMQGISGGTAVPISGSVTATVSGTPNVAVTSEVGVGSTGSAVPSTAQYGGMNVGGTLTGLTGTANGMKVDGSAVTQPVSGSVTATISGTPTVTANAGTNLNTSLLATDAHLTALGTSALATDAHATAVQSAPGTPQTTALTIQGNASGVAVPVSGSVTATISGTPTVTANAGTGTFAISASSLPLPTGAATASGLTTINTTLGSPFQAGGSIGNTSFGATITQWGGATLGAATGFGTAPTGTVQGVNADLFVGGAAAATGNPVPVAYGSGVSLPSGSNTIGGVTIAPSTSGGISGKGTVTVTALQLIGSAGAHQIYRLQCDNLAGAANVWVEVFDAASTGAVTLGTTTPSDHIAIAAAGTGGFTLSGLGVQYSSGIVVAAVTAYNGTTAASTAVPCDFDYK